MGQMVILPLVFGVVLQLPACFIFTTRLPNVLVAVWDYNQMTTLNGHRHRHRHPSPVVAVQIEKETKKRARVFRHMCLYALIWVIAIVFMFWVEADDRESYRTGPIHRYHNRIRCVLEAVSPIHEKYSQCSRPRLLSAHPAHTAHDLPVHFNENGNENDTYSTIAAHTTDNLTTADRLVRLLIRNEN
jgi:hypothetical protein